jgi:hypothetical protein
MTKRVIDINEHIIKKYIESLRPDNLEIRKKLDFGYSYDEGIVILYEVRPVWNDAKKIQQIEFAKIRYIKSRQLWNLYRMRASGRWELYEPFSESTHLEQILEIIKEDEHGCFFG